MTGDELLTALLITLMLCITIYLIIAKILNYKTEVKRIENHIERSKTSSQKIQIKS